MTFDEVTRAAAHLANKAVGRAMDDMRHKYAYDEDDVTGVLVGRLHSEFENSKFDGVSLKASILRHRKGVAAEERRVGADLLMHVSMDTNTQSYSKGVLIQSKKATATDYWSSDWRSELTRQCNTMLAHTPASFVFSYSERGVRCGSATRVVGGLNNAPTSLSYLCEWTAYRFFLELFRCPIGDRNITSVRVEELPVPFALQLGFEGTIDLDEGASRA